MGGMGDAVLVVQRFLLGAYPPYTSLSPWRKEGRTDETTNSDVRQEDRTSFGWTGFGKTKR